MLLDSKRFFAFTMQFSLIGIASLSSISIDIDLHFSKNVLDRCLDRDMNRTDRSDDLVFSFATRLSSLLHMSKIFYKFKSSKDYDTALFDGVSLSVFDLKREIMLGKKLGAGTDFDLALHDAQTNEGAL
jgi:hypothetical protein